MSSLKNICFEHIKDTFYYGQFGQFKLVIDKKTGFFNVTKLCELANKKYSNWCKLEKSKNLIYFLKSCYIIKLSYEIRLPNNIKQNKVITGTYLHSDFLSDILLWMMQTTSYNEPNFKGVIYIVTNDILEKQHIYNVGYTKNLNKKLEQFNEYRLSNYEPLFRSIKVFNTFNIEQLKQYIHAKLFQYRISNTEFFQCPIDIILNLCELEYLDKIISEGLSLLFK